MSETIRDWDGEENVLRQKLRNRPCVGVLVPIEPNPAHFTINVCS